MQYLSFIADLEDIVMSGGAPQVILHVRLGQHSLFTAVAVIVDTERLPCSSCKDLGS